MGHFKKLFNKKQFLTIPNMLSLFRLLMIPAIVYFYVNRNNPLAAVLVIAVSAITDMLDGYIARKYDMVSDLGKALDPLADKLTICAMFICLISRRPWIVWFLIFLIVKELAQLGGGLLVLRRGGNTYSSKWFGKLGTVLLYTTSIALFLFPNIPDKVAKIMCIVSAAMQVVSLIMYLSIDRKKIAAEKEKSEDSQR